MRKPKYNSDTCAKVLMHIEEGRTVKDVCRLYGITDMTFGRWRKRFHDFNEAYINAVRRQWRNAENLKMKVSEHTKEKRKIKEANAMIKNLEESQRAPLALQLKNYNSFEKYHKGELEKIEEIINDQKTIRAQAEEKSNKLDKTLPTKEDFSNLIQSYLEILQKTDRYYCSR